MTIKQYGSLTLDLNTIRELVELDCQPTIILFCGTNILLNLALYNQIKEDYREFTLNKRLKVIKDAFDFVFDSNIKVISEGLNCSKPIIDLSYIKFDYLNLIIDREGFFWGDNFKGKLNEFNIKASDDYIWLRYARQINQAYLDSIVDPVKVANQVLKLRGLDKDWVAQRNINGKELILASNAERLSFYPSNVPGKLTIWAGIGWRHYLEGDISIDYPTTNSEWVKAIEFALDKYYELNKVDPVKVAEQLIKSRGLNLWVVSNKNPKYYFHLVNTNIYPNEVITFRCSCLMFATAETSEWGFCREHDKLNTKSDWEEFITEALDRYYEFQQSPQPSEVDLKLMLAKALKDNGLVAKLVVIPYASTEKAIVEFENHVLKWVTNYSGDTFLSNGNIKVLLITDNTQEAFLSYSAINSKDWQTIFSDSLAHYKKLITHKLTVSNILDCLSKTLNQSKVRYWNRRTNLEGSSPFAGYLEVMLEGNQKLIWQLNEKIVEGFLYLTETGQSRCLITSDTPTTLQQWEDLFTQGIIKSGVNINKEPTLLDLIKQAFPSYQWKIKAHHKETWEGISNSYTLQVYIVEDKVFDFNILDKKGYAVKKVCKPQYLFTKENLSNYSNWEQWLEELIKVNQNLKDLEQSPNLVVKAIQQLPQRVKNVKDNNQIRRSISLRELKEAVFTTTDLDDPWMCD